jgi:hypothetical protein
VFVFVCQTKAAERSLGVTEKEPKVVIILPETGERRVVVAVVVGVGSARVVVATGTDVDEILSKLSYASTVYS